MMLVSLGSRGVTATLLLVILLGQIHIEASRKVKGRGRSRGRVPCPHRRCRCRRGEDGVRAECPAVAQEVPEFRDRNLTYASLELVDRNLSSLRAEAFISAPTRRLDVTANGFGERGIEVTAFAGLEEVLVSLSLSFCKLTEVPSLALRNLSALEELHLDTNNIQTLEKKMFKNNGQLRELLLFRNQLETIDANAFSGLDNLQTLKLFENNLTQLPKKLFRHLGNLTSLDLSSNQLRVLSNSVFRGLERLTWLQLQGNQVSALGKHVFRGLKSLMYLKLHGNPLLSIAPGAFKPLPRLDFLDIDITNVTALTRRSFSGLKRLRTLFLGEANREGLPGGLLRPCPRLKQLSVYDRLGKLSRGLEAKAFGKKTRFAKMNIYVEPFHACTCDVRWIRALTHKGALVRGTCTGDDAGRPIHCMHARKSRRKGGQDAPIEPFRSN